jgi:hypothetical protein
MTDRSPTRPVNKEKWQLPPPRRPIRKLHPSDLAVMDKNGTPVHGAVVWRDYVIGPDGPPKSTSRLVLCALSVHMDTQGYAFPSIELLALECHLSQSAVKRHLEFAAAEGWIRRTSSMGYKLGWRKYEYEASIPVYEGNFLVRPRSDWNEVRFLNRRIRTSSNNRVDLL